jgi:hypothetical protein
MTIHPAPKPKLRAKRVPKPLKKGNSARRSREWKRAYGSVERVAFVKGLECVVGFTCWGKMENAHTETGGKGRKGDAESIVPLCKWHHHMIHQHGMSFYGSIDWRAAAAKTHARWQAFIGQEKSA